MLILNTDHEIDNMNLAAARFFHGQAVAGSQYYSVPTERPSDAAPDAGEPEPDIDRRPKSEADLLNLFPWIRQELARHHREGMETSYFEKEVVISGQNKFLGVRITKSLDISEKFGGVIIIFEDLTPLRNEQKALIEREKLQAVLETVGMVYHELNQPLQVLCGLSEIMLMEQEATPQQKKHIQQISLASQNLSNIIKKLHEINTYRAKPYVGQSSIIDLDESSKTHD